MGKCGLFGIPGGGEGIRNHTHQVPHCGQKGKGFLFYGPFLFFVSLLDPTKKFHLRQQHSLAQSLLDFCTFVEKFGGCGTKTSRLSPPVLNNE